ncbi:MAG: (2Fe-2S)-binding protein, partial [Pseudomonadota bacterium]
MRQQTQIELTEQLFAHLDAKTTAMSDQVTINPVTAYTSEDRLQREQDLLRSEPIVMGLSCTLPEPQSYLTDDNT